MKYKLIVSDFDDTIVDDSQYISESTINAIRDYEQRGGKFVFCTGRMISAIIPHARKMGLKGDIIGYQGAVVADIESGAFLIEHAIPNDKAIDVAEYLEAKGLYYQLYQNDTFVIEKENDYSTLYRKFTFKEPIVVGESLLSYMKRIKLSPTKILLINEPENIPCILEELQSVFGDRLLINSSKRFIIEIVPLGINKGSAVRDLAEKYNLSLDDVIVVGDGLNDIPMLSCGAYGIAVENANPKLKEIADNVTDLEGVMDSIEELSTGIDTALDKYSQVILSIIEQINSKCDAVIIIQTLYDPFAKVPAAFMFQGLSKDKIEKLDEIIKVNAVDENGEQRYYVCDIYDTFKNKGLELTNMSKNDIHPNAEGHKLIAQKLDEKIRELTYTYDPSAVPAEPAQTEPESSSATEADNADSESSETVTAAKKMIEGHEDTVRTIIAVSACVLGAAALAVLIMTKEKKK